MRPTTGRPSLNVESLEAREVLTPLTPGGIVSGSVAAGGTSAWTFTGTAGNTVELITTSTAAQSGFTAYADVYAPSNTRVAGSWPNNNVILNLTETGTYTVRMRDDNNTESGTFTIGLEGLKPISPSPSQLVKGGIASGTVSARTEKDQWTFTGEVGQRIELITTSTATQSGFTAYIDVYAPSGTRVAGSWPNNNVVLNLEESGTYMIQVRDDNYAETGNYTIGFEGLLPISPAPGSLVKGGLVSGSIDARTEKDQLTFAGVAGERVELISTSTAGLSGFTAYVDVYAPSGTRVAGFWPGNNVVLDLLETGNYTVQVRDDNYAETGGYTIGFEGLKPISPGATPIVKGKIVTGSIDAPTEKDQWTFTGTAGDRIELISTSTATRAGFTAYVDVYGPSGTRIAGFWPNSNTTLDLPETGTYMIQVRDDNYAETGGYTIGLESLNPISADAKTLQPNVAVSATIGKATKKDQWTINVPEGRRLRVVLTGTAISPEFRAYANIFDAAGNRVAGMWAGKETFVLEPGRYTIQVSDAYLVRKGSYTLKAKPVV